jgi:hypothetical protein
MTPVTNSVAFIMRSLQAGVSAVIGIQGDSTSIDFSITDTSNLEWFLGGILQIVPAIPTCQIMYKSWSDTAQDYGAWQVIQTGAQGERYVSFTLANSRSAMQSNLQIGDFDTDIDFRVRVAPDLWTPAATQTFVARQGGVGSRGFEFHVLNTGAVEFLWYPNPAVESFLSISASAGAIGGVNATPLWLRATVQLNNGLGGYTATLYTSPATDGINWTQVAQTVTTTGGATTVGMPTGIQYEIGARGSSVDPLSGAVFETQLRNGIGGPIMDTQPIENWSTTNASAVGGSPTLYVINGSWAGKNLTYFGDATRFPLMVTSTSPGIWILNDGHNENALRGIAIVAALNTYYAQLQTRAPLACYAICAQNPEAVATGGNPQPPYPNANARTREMGIWGIRNGWYVIDLGAAIMNAGPGASLIGPDGVHPTLAGYVVEAAAFARPLLDAVPIAT